MKRYFLYFVFILVALACSTADMVQTVTPSALPVEESTGAVYLPEPTSALDATPFFSTPADFGTLTLDDQRTVCTDALNVRSGAGTESAAVAWLYQGDIVHVLESRDGWARLASPAGWVKAVYLCQ